MTQAIALPVSASPAASALLQAAGGATTPASTNQGFLTVLAELFGVADPAATGDAAQATLPAASAKPQQPARTPGADGTQVDPSLLAATMLPATTPPALTPKQTDTAAPATLPAAPAPFTVQVIAGQVAFAAEPAATHAPTSIVPPGLLAAAPKTAKIDDAPQAAPAETPSQPGAPVTTEPSAQQAQLLQAMTVAAPELASTAKPSPAPKESAAPIGRAAPKPAATKQAPVASASFAGTPANGEVAPNAQTQATSLKGEPGAVSQSASPAHTPGDGANGNAPQLPDAKVETAAPQPASSSAPTPFIATVNTATATPATPTSALPFPAVPVDALAVHIARKVESGESRFQIRLDPAELGKLDISMTVADDGRVHAVVRAERPETLDLLQRDSRQLENQLRQSGLNVDSNSLNFSLGQGNSNRQAFAGPSQPFAAARDIAPEIETPKTTTAIVTVRDGVDIRI